MAPDTSGSVRYPLPPLSDVESNWREVDDFVPGLWLQLLSSSNQPVPPEPENEPVDPLPRMSIERNNQPFHDTSRDYRLDLHADIGQRTGDEYDNTSPALMEDPFEEPLSPYTEWLESLPSPIPDKRVPFQYFCTYPPARQTSHRKNVQASSSRLQTQPSSDYGATRTGGSIPTSVINAPRQNDGQDRAESGTEDNELPQQDIDQHGTSSAPAPPRRPVSSTGPIPAATEQHEIVFPCPYTDEQLRASDEHAWRTFRAPANMRMSPVACTRAIRKVFPFYGTGIPLKDKEGGYYTLDADGLPVPHDRVLKADSEAGGEADEPTRRKRKTVHQLQKPTAECDPRRWYDEWKFRPGSWPPDNKFIYLEDAQLAYREYSTEDIKLYLAQCPRKYILWVQSEPSQSSHRRHNRNGKPLDEDSKCRWAGCPIKGRAVVGLYRVAFDEFPAQTSQGIKDPYKVAMLMHLWCFEQILDPVVYYSRRLLLPDTRTFATPSPEASHAASEALERDAENVGAAEMKNNFCSKLGDAHKARADWGPLNHAFYPWFRMTEATETLPRAHERSLCYRLTSWCVENLPKCKTDQFDKRMQARGEKKTEEERNKQREEEEAREKIREERNAGLVAGRGADELPSESEAFRGTTFHVHLGSLAGYKRALEDREQERDKSKKRRRGTLVPENNDPQTQEAESSAAAGRGGEVGLWPDVRAQPGDVARPSKRRRTEAD
ncbi:hypothetical protein E4U53_002354 [Claviceps sorghi]|nr:hypothetical protein E4U53_002354 [Claviceps sorghi]